MEDIKIRYDSLAKCAEMMVRGGMIIRTTAQGSLVVKFPERDGLRVTLSAARGQAAWANDFFSGSPAWVSIPPETIKRMLTAQKHAARLSC